MKQEIMRFWDGSGISWTISKQSAPHSRQITTSTPHHSIFTGRMLFLIPNQYCQIIEGSPTVTWMEVNIADTSYVGLHLFCKISRHMLPSAYTTTQQMQKKLNNANNVALIFMILWIVQLSCESAGRLHWVHIYLYKSDSYSLYCTQAVTMCSADTTTMQHFLSIPRPTPSCLQPSSARSGRFISSICCIIIFELIVHDGSITCTEINVTVSLRLQCFDTVGWVAGRASGL